MKDCFGTKLRRIRQIYGYSQAQVAFHCGITQAAYCKKEQGEKIPSVERLMQLATLYKIDLKDIVELEVNQLLIIAHKVQISILESKVVRGLP